MRWSCSSIPILLLLAVSAPLAAQDYPAYPEEVSLNQEGSLGYVYRRSSTSQRLYTYDRDRPGQSVCNQGCTATWSPVSAPQNASKVGEWTAFVRSDGTKQWALKGKPVYTQLNDKPDEPGGDGREGVWHLVPYSASPANPVFPAR